MNSICQMLCTTLHRDYYAYNNVKLVATTMTNCYVKFNVYRNVNCYMMVAICQILCANYYMSKVIYTHMSNFPSKLLCWLPYQSQCQIPYVKCCMSNAICQLAYLKFYMSNFYMSSAMTIECLLVWLQNRFDIHYIYPLPDYDFLILPLLSCYYGFTPYLKSPFILVRRHIMASNSIFDHRLFQFTDISWHRTIYLITIYFGLPIYHDIIW
jgi:hypothetical protein